MKQPVVDYRKFRFSKLNDPEFSHLKLLAGWLVYFLFYFLTENFIPYDACHVMPLLSHPCHAHSHMAPA